MVTVGDHLMIMGALGSGSALNGKTGVVTLLQGTGGGAHPDKVKFELDVTDATDVILKSFAKEVFIDPKLLQPFMAGQGGVPPVPIPTARLVAVYNYKASLVFAVVLLFCFP